MTGRERGGTPAGGEPVGLYLHIPFCRSKCPFCDFCSFPRPDAAMVEAYVDELIRRIRQAKYAAEEAGASLFVLDGAVIVGTEAEAECDRLAVVTAPFETSVARIAKRDGIAPEMAARRLNAQTPEEALLARADYVLRNDADLAALEAAANALCEQLLAEGGTKGGARPSV